MDVLQRTRKENTNQPNKLSELQHLIKYHIESFRSRSHYSSRVNSNRKYLSEELFVIIMHKLFVQEFQINFPYQSYYSIFHNQYNLHFRLSSSNTYSLSDLLELQILSAETIEKKNEKEIQKKLRIKKSEKFHAIKNLYKAQAQQGKKQCFLLITCKICNCPT
ncbi:hypothetical protein ILUMI_07317 [Ignelater luminosus]|uniref:Uncharacterized protein n=1 Tax=Ignelater luminosus TaxID=2038154 RepID=A0A8K0GGF8_IGNLU|nr:hypothetical protein ILUMI_07317 [Ignelater luminosus]